MLAMGRTAGYAAQVMTRATRFAPSPTGALHLGHAYSALVAHDAARQVGGRFLLRIDDLDGGRCRAEYRHAIDDDLAWLGLLPDAPPLVQSTRLPAYAAALDLLIEADLAYPCFCTRADIAAEMMASVAAPHGPDGPLYPGICRHLAPAERAGRMASGAGHAWRLNVARAAAQAGPLDWLDASAGRVQALPTAFGDIILARKDAPAAYHLASTLDDAHLGISHVVRGADLFAATHVHRLLQALLGLPTPGYVHHALVAGPDGRRLAKRHDAASIASLRAAGVEPDALKKDLRDGRLPMAYRWLRP